VETNFEKVDRELLTEVVLGLLRYLPHKLWFRGFVETVRAVNPALGDWFTADSAPTVSLWPFLPVPTEWGNKLGTLPGHRGGPVPVRTVCPEAVIETGEWIAVINAADDETGDGKEILQDFAVNRFLAGDKPHLTIHINAAELRRLNAGISMGGVDPTKRVAPTDTLEWLISVSSERLPMPSLSEDAVAVHLGWLGWYQLHRLLRSIRLENDPDFTATPPLYQSMIKGIVSDAVALLESAGLYRDEIDMLEMLRGMTIDARLVPQLGAVEEPLKRGWDVPVETPDTAPVEFAEALPAEREVEDVSVVGEEVAPVVAEASENVEPVKVVPEPAVAAPEPALGMSPVPEAPQALAPSQVEEGLGDIVAYLIQFNIDVSAIPELQSAERTK